MILMSDESLFSIARSLREPLAARMRPRNLDEYIGQDHIVGKGRLLRRAIAADQLTSVIFYGPPGSGKTTLARVIANHTKSNFITLNAVLTGVQDIRESIKSAEDYFNLYSRRTILFVDEVHRWNKSQQDALLPWVENGTIILIGATTENPFFEVNKALVSRSRVFQLKPLTYEDLMKAAKMALEDKERGYGRWKVEFEEGALEHLVETANGDARSLLNALELAVETTPEKWDPDATEPVPAYGSTIYISKEASEESIQKKVVLYDRDGDYHYDIISAFIKSLRGRDPDAACYWLARMVRMPEGRYFLPMRLFILQLLQNPTAAWHFLMPFQPLKKKVRMFRITLRIQAGMQRVLATEADIFILMLTGITGLLSSTSRIPLWDGFSILQQLRGMKVLYGTMF